MPPYRTPKPSDDPAACPYCHFPPGQPGLIQYDVPLSDPRFGRTFPCPECHDRLMAKQLAKSSQLTGWLEFARFSGYRADQYNMIARDSALSVCQKPSGWLTLWGGYGCGKTHLLAAIVNECIRYGIAAVYYTLPDLLDRLRSGYSDGSYDPVLQRLCDVRVLCIDEVDKARTNDWAGEKGYQLFDARYRWIGDRATVFAMNREPVPSGDKMDYLLSRMNDRRARVVMVGGGDIRPMEVV